MALRSVVAVDRHVVLGEVAGEHAVAPAAHAEPDLERDHRLQARDADLIAMSTHGHRGLNDLLRGTTVNRVRHEVKIPVLLLRAQ